MSIKIRQNKDIIKTQKDGRENKNIWNFCPEKRGVKFR